MAMPLIEKALVVIGIDDPDLIKNWRGLHRSHQNELVVFWRGIGTKPFHGLNFPYPSRTCGVPKVMWGEVRTGGLHALRR
ncbi:hypothetical protein HZ326_29553 [Fusarium oxysporum f. sp. albedinis]|nr:hypothetical protein HZ326_29553 [Fusarium oxysporum f. sp. albedinis]